MATHDLPTKGMLALAAALALFVTAVAWRTSSAKTPDGMPPSQEQVCSGLQGAAFGLCNAYCEAQDCDVHPRPSCAALRRNFARLTGSPVLPCDAVCGDGTVNQRTEECDPPGSACADERVCQMDCTCPEPVCGDGILDSGEQCDPPGAPCPNDPNRSCRDDCTCPQPFCGDGIIDPGEACDPPNSACGDGGLCTPNCACIFTTG
jgi:hypothetical protein